MTDEVKQKLEELKKTAYGFALHDYLEEKLKELNSLDKIPKEGFELEGRARQEAVRIIRDIFYFLEKREEPPHIKKIDYR